MKRVVLFLFVMAAIVAVVTAEPKRSKKKKVAENNNGNNFSWAKPPQPQPLLRKDKSLPLDEIDEIAENELEPQGSSSSGEDGGADDSSLEKADPAAVAAVKDPCKDVKCTAGRECRWDESAGGQAKCQCVEECGYEIDPRRQVCSNQNETFNTDCDLYRMRCLCEDGDVRCKEAEKFKHVHIEYYGECRNIPECSEDELSDFPRRMREWLFNVMQELSERHELSKYYQKMEKQAEKELSKRWSNAAIWKWCDLDGHPHDNVVSRHELFPVKAPLQTLEHCIGDFLDSCDANDDHSISLKEWGACLELEESDLIAECEKLE